jgi:hypothetical protein
MTKDLRTELNEALASAGYGMVEANELQEALHLIADLKAVIRMTDDHYCELKSRAENLERENEKWRRIAAERLIPAANADRLERDSRALNETLSIVRRQRDDAVNALAVAETELDTARECLEGNAIILLAAAAANAQMRDIRKALGVGEYKDLVAWIKDHMLKYAALEQVADVHERMREDDFEKRNWTKERYQHFKDLAAKQSRTIAEYVNTVEQLDAEISSLKDRLLT